MIQISPKEKPFQSHKKLSAIWVNLTLHHHSLPLPKKTFQRLSKDFSFFPSVWPSSQYPWYLISKNTFSFVSAPYPTGRVERG